MPRSDIRRFYEELTESQRIAMRHRGEAPREFGKPGTRGTCSGCGHTRYITSRGQCSRCAYPTQRQQKGVS